MKPLDDIRVLDLSRLLPGPFATKLLQDMGAQVDKVEDPTAGDYLRDMPPRNADGGNAAFDLLNRGKRSIVLDLKSSEGRANFLKLVARYDVVLESFRPGVMERLGLGQDTLLAANPKLITCAISGYGQDGPLADRACHDLNCLGRSGALAFFGPSDGPPALPGAQLADVGSGIYAALGIVAALRQRDRTGEGAYLDISMTESAASFSAFGFATRAGGVDPGRGNDVLTGGFAVYGSYETSDGRYVTLASLEAKFWSRFCAGSGFEGTKMDLFPGPHQAVLVARLEALFKTRTRAEWTEFGAEHDCCLEPVLEPIEALEDAQLRARKLFGADLSTLSTPAAPASEGVAPARGQHTEEILSENRAL